LSQGAGYPSYATDTATFFPGYLLMINDDYGFGFDLILDFDHLE